MSHLPRIAILGMGKMGAAMALRLRDNGHAVSIWNRSASKAAAVQAQLLAGECHVGESAAATVKATTADATVMLILSDTVTCNEMIDAIVDQLHGRIILNLTSGSPDDGRQVEAKLSVPELGLRAYIDGAYCGPPAKARSGSGVLFLSSSAPEEVDRLTPMLSALGEVAFAGPVGTSRALDYAVVDLALTCYTSFLSNVEMLEREGVDRAQLYEHMSKRIHALPAALSMLHARTEDRSDDAYLTHPVVTLATLHTWWTSRLPYFDRHAIPNAFPRFMASLLERAAASDHWEADVTRMQEALRPSTTIHDAKRPRNDGTMADSNAAAGTPDAVTTDTAQFRNWVQ
eukprot:CAMPEP_0119299120 /NCGR_PEP_ID=MMETSP1333-20130426/1231_1 /TAXON_ID=418940 /ORGANISM="Scyphosphaera apsteinii, Strain RCC1455" /LENGTH=343 /DNA_ID=CAMNT_0007300441 /DNA_START=38 /DNA_END=1069 /DNA_ORIENTATION=-